MKKSAPLLIFVLAGLITLLPWVSGAVALLMGMSIALTLGNPRLEATRRLTPKLLQASVIGLGGAMNLTQVAAVGAHGVFYTTLGISLTMLLGKLFGHWIGTPQATTILISAGTAICGGSAIAAVAPVIRARDQEVSVSLATVFFLNASALLLFPWIGHVAGFTETQFGYWSALAIHDTSSVVGAALQYGPRALEVATTVKLARALWIVPTTLAIGLFWSDGGERKPAKKPWFILGFVLVSALVSFVPFLRPLGQEIAWLSKRALVLTLFLIGSGLSRVTLRAVGIRPFTLGVLLWMTVAAGSFIAVSAGWIR